MIAIDTSSLIAYLSGHAGLDVEATGLALEHRQAVLPPVVLSELLSEPAYSGRRPSRGSGKRRWPMCSSHKPAWITTSSWSRAIMTSTRWRSWQGCG